MLTVALSLSRIVTVAGVASTVMAGSPAVMPVSVTITVSSISTRLSSMMPPTSMVAVVWVAAIVTVPDSVA